MVSLASPGGSMLPPPLPTSKRPTFAMKRDSSYLDQDSDTGISTPMKKLKVAFSPNVDVRVVDDFDEKSLDLVKEEIHVAVERHLAPASQRDDSHYSKILALLGHDARQKDAPGEKLLRKYILGVQAKLNLLADCGKLVMAIVDLSWTGRSDAFVALYVKFLCSLATAHAKYVPSIMDNLVSYFVKLPSSAYRLPDQVPVSRSVIYSRIHLAVRTMIRHLPSATSALVRAVKFQFPTDLGTTRSYLNYQQHLIRLADYLPELKAEILALITQRLVSVDVEIQQDLEDLDDEVEDGILQRANLTGSAPEADEESDSDSYSESEETITEDEQRIREIRLKVAKMDGTLDLLFDYYTPLVQETLRPELSDSFQQLLSHFQTFILPSRTRHAQFLLFHFSQMTAEHTAAFAKYCLEIAMRAGSLTQRLSACAYMSSFVARGAHVSRESVQDIFEVLCTFLDEMRTRYEGTCRGPDRRSYSMYYAVAQAILYIFCFRWRDLVTGSATPESGDADLSEDDVLAEGRELAWFPGIKAVMHKNIYSILNPLKVCSPGIVGEFAKIAHHLRFMYVFPKLETNKRIRLGNTAALYSSSSVSEACRRETAVDRKTGEAHLQLEAFFPFDPYHLPRSKSWIEGDYNEWKLPSGMSMEDDEEEDDDDDDDSNDGDDDGDENLESGSEADIDEALLRETDVSHLRDDVSISS